MLKTIHAPSLNRNIKFGRKRPIGKPMKMHLSTYLRAASLPPLPPSCDYTSGARNVLANIYGNDTLGDCVIAGGAHVVGIETGNAGPAPFQYSSAQIIKEYSAIGGYVPGHPETDQGCNEQTAFNYWQDKGFADGTKLLAALAIDATNIQEVQTAMYLFENLFFGVELPDPWVAPFPEGDGFVWDVNGPPDEQNGHCFIGVGYNTTGVLIDTWGMIGTVTYKAVGEYASAKGHGELYVLLTPDQIAKGQEKAPNGFAWAQLIADFNAMGGNVPDPVPTPLGPPAPVPTPPPDSVVTLAQAQAWVIQGFAAGRKVVTREQAEVIARNALRRHWPKS